MHASWRRSPFVRIGLSFLAGIALGRAFPPPEGWLASIPVICVVGGLCVVSALSLIPVRHPGSVRPGLILYCSFIGFGILQSTIHLVPGKVSHYLEFEESSAMIVRVMRMGKCDSTRATLYAEAIRLRSDTEWQAVRGDVLVQLHHPLENYIPGDLMYLPSHHRALNAATLPWSFDYAAYLRERGIERRIAVDATKSIRLRTLKGDVQRWLHEWRETLKTRISDHIPDPATRGVLYALVLGDDREMDRSLTDAYSAAGTVHLLAVSGLHVGMIYAVLTAIFSRVPGGRRTRWLRLLIQASLLWVYAGITGASPSVLRASLMFTFFLIAGHVGKQNNSLNTLFASAALLLCIDPGIATELGFQLSYLAVGGILLLQKPIELLVNVQNPLLRNAWALASVSLAAQLTTLPLTVHTFGQFPLYFLLANLLVIPLATVSLYLGVLFLALSQWPVVAAPVAGLLAHITSLMNRAIRGIGELPGSTLDQLYTDSLGFTLLIVCTAGIMCGLLGQKKTGYWLVAVSITLLIGQGSIHTIHGRQFRESLLCEVHGQVVFVHTQCGRTVIYSDEPERCLHKNNPLSSYLRRLRTTVYTIPWDKSDNPAWVELFAGRNDKGIVIFREGVGTQRITGEALESLPGSHWTCTTGISTGKQRFLAKRAAERGLEWHPLRDGALVHRGSGWVPFTTYY